MSVKVQSIRNTSFGADEDTADVNLPEPVGALGSAFVRLVSTNPTVYAGPHAGSELALNNKDGGFFAQLISTSQYRLERLASGANNDARIQLEVWEYTGAAGGDNEFIVRHRGKISIANGVTQQDSANITVDVPSDCVPFLQGFSSDVANRQYFRVACTADVIDNGDGTVKVRFKREALTGITGDIELAFVLVEFTGANWIVEKVAHTFSAKDTTEEETLSTATGDWSTKFVYFTRRIGNQNVAHTGTAVWPGAADKVRFRIDNDSGLGGEVIAYVVENEQLSVQHDNSIDGSIADPETDRDQDYTVGAVSDLEAVAVFLSHTIPGSSTTYGKQFWDGRMTTATNLALTRTQNGPASGETMVFQVVDFAGLGAPTIGGGSAVDVADQVSGSLTPAGGEKAASTVALADLVRSTLTPQLGTRASSPLAIGSTLAGATTLQRTIRASSAVSVGSTPAGLTGLLFSDDNVCLATAFLRGATERVADIWVRSPDAMFEADVERYGSVTRSVGFPTGGPEAGLLVLNLVDPENRWRRIFGTNKQRRAFVEVVAGPAGGSISVFQRVFRGRVEDVEFPPGRVQITLLDVTLLFLDNEIAGLINKENFPGLLDEKFEGFSPMPFGTLDSTKFNRKGAVELVRVSDRQWNAARFPIAGVDKLYSQLPGDEVAKAASLPFSLVEEVKTIEGTEYAFQHVKLSTSLEEGARLFADLRGLESAGDGTGAVIENMADVMRQLLLRPYLAGRKISELNSSGFENTREILEQKGWKVSGAVISGSTFRQVLKEMMNSSAVKFFADRDGLLKVKLPTGDQANAHHLTALFDIEEDGFPQRMATPTANQFEYRFGRSFATGEWGGKLTYNNEIDQQALGEIIKGDPLEFWFVQDQATAVGVAAEHAAYLSEESLRVSARVRGTEHYIFVDLADEFLITHADGVTASEDGFEQERFVCRALEWDKASDRLIISGIRRVVLESTAGFLFGHLGHQAIPGPWPISTLEHLTIHRDPANSKKLKAQSTVNGGTFVERDAAGAPVTTNNILAFETSRLSEQSDLVHVVTQEATTWRVEYHAFDVRQRVWVVTNEHVFTPTQLPQAHLDDNIVNAWCSVCELDPSGTIVAFFNGEPTDLGSRLNQTPQYSKRSGVGSWSAPVDVGEEQDELSGFGVPFSYVGGRVAPGKNNLAHFFYRRRPGQLRSIPDLIHRTLDSSNAFSVEVRFQLGGSLNKLPSHHPYGKWGRFVDTAGDVFLYMPWRYTDSVAFVGAFKSGSTLSLLNGPPFHPSALTTLQGEISGQQVAAPMISANKVSGKVYVGYSARLSLADQTGWITQKEWTDPSGAIVPPTTGTCPDGEGGSVNCGLWHRASPVLDQFAQAAYATFFLSNGQVWMASLVHVINTKVQAAINKTGSSTFILWEIRPVADLPLASSFDLAAWAAQLP